MRWMLLAVVGLLLLIAAITVIGALLPREHRATATAEFRRDPRVVWSVLTDFAGLVAWMPGVRTVVPAPSADGHARWSLTTEEGNMTLEVVELTPPRRFVTRIVDEGLPFGGTWSYDLTATPAGTRVTIVEDGWISNPLYRFFARYVFGLDTTIKGALRALGRRLGETVTPVTTRREPARTAVS
jgi:uncharacterized protein YndB with AHSA1/START domain